MWIVFGTGSQDGTSHATALLDVALDCAPLEDRASLGGVDDLELRRQSVLDVGLPAKALLEATSRALHSTQDANEYAGRLLARPRGDRRANSAEPSPDSILEPPRTNVDVARSLSLSRERERDKAPQARDVASALSK